METRSRLNNLRLVGLPEGAEGTDTCVFLERWIPEMLGAPVLQSPLVLERSHRIGQRRDPNASPKTLVMKFLNFKDAINLIKAARAKKEVLHRNQQVRFYPDLATGVHKHWKKFNIVGSEPAPETSVSPAPTSSQRQTRPQPSTVPPLWWDSSMSASAIHAFTLASTLPARATDTSFLASAAATISPHPGLK